MDSPKQALSGKTAVVTGASSGIGRAIAVALAERGAYLFLHARSNQDGLDETAALAAKQGAATRCVLHDLSDTKACRQLVQEAWDWQPVDAWVHNAGADVLTGDAAGMNFEDKLDLLWRVDVRGATTVCRDAGARMKQQGHGALVTIGWDQAQQGMAGDSGEMFSATKGAVMAFTQSLARSLAPQVRVNCIAPGWIRTKWGDDAPEYWNRRAVEESLLGRWGEPADVAAAAAWLVSPQASFITGQTINVNGGFAGQAE